MPLPLAFWQLGSAWMLLWGIAAALPILIHLWSRRRHRPERWAAMGFLLAAMRKNARRIQLEQWLLLAVRTALLSLFALALADPQFRDLAAWGGGSIQGQRHVLLVIDASYSMGFRDEQKTRFEAAKEAAREIVRQGPIGNGYTLVLLASPARAIIGEPAFDPDDVLEELANLEPTHAGASLAGALAEIERIVRHAAEHEPRLVERRVVFLTDLQHATWSEVDSPECQARFRTLAALADLQLVDCGRSGDENFALVGLALDRPLVAINQDLQLHVHAESFADEERPRQPIEVLLDGQRIADERIDLAARGRASVAIPLRPKAPGDHVVEVRLADDALPLDNRRWLVLEVRPAIRVLAVGGRSEETRHLALAIDPQEAASGAIQVIQIPESRLAEEDLSRYDCVFLANLGRFSREEAGLLHRFVSGGGGLIVFLGDQAESASYNDLLVDDANTRVLPARLGTTVATGTHKVDPRGYAHPIVAPFRGFEQAGLLTTPIWKYVQLQPLEGAQTVLGLNNGDPLIVEVRVGQGRTILVATAASPDSVDRSTSPPTSWTALSSWPSFPPLVHEMLQFAAQGRGLSRNRTVGDDLHGALATANENAILLTGPDGLSERLPMNPKDGQSAWTFPAAPAAGIYRLEADGDGQTFAVNVDAREGDLSRLDPDRLPSQFHAAPLAAAEGVPALMPLAGSPWFRWLLGAALLLLVLEPVLACRFAWRRQ